MAFDAKEYSKRYRAANKERIAKRRAEWLQKNEERLRVQHKTYYDAHKERIAERATKWVREHREQRNAYCREWYRLNKIRKEHDRKMAAGSLPIIIVEDYERHSTSNTAARSTTA